jgi:hypothetical protein
MTTNTTGVSNLEYLNNGVISDTLGVDTDNYNPTGLSSAGVILITNSTTSAINITGITTPGARKVLTITNVSNNVSDKSIYLKHNDVSSSANNRIELPLGDLKIAPQQSVTLLYNTTTNRWKIMDGQGSVTRYVADLTELGNLVLENPNTVAGTERVLVKSEAREYILNPTSLPSSSDGKFVVLASVDSGSGRWIRGDNWGRPLYTMVGNQNSVTAGTTVTLETFGHTADGNVYVVRGMAGAKAASSTKMAGWNFFAAFRRSGGSLTLISTVDKSTKIFGAADFDVNIKVDDGDATLIEIEATADTTDATSFFYRMEVHEG